MIGQINHLNLGKYWIGINDDSRGMYNTNIPINLRLQC